MQLRTLGGTGMQVSPLCLGAMMFGAIGNRDHDECVRIIHRSIDAGINFIDTADGYSRGESEEIIGKAIKGRRERLVIATKFYATMSDDPNMRGASRRWVTRAVEDSLRRLGIDHIDLYQLHRWDDVTDLEETLFTLTDLVRQGKIRAFGCSSFPADRIVESHWIAEKRGTQRFRCNQPAYSIFNREIERFILPASQRHGMGTITFSPLDGGYLSGRYRKPEDMNGENRFAYFGRITGRGFDPYAEAVRRKLDLVAELSALADEAGISLAHMAIAFVIQHPGVTSAILGPRTLDQLEGLLGATDVRLSAETLDRIDALVPPGTSLNPINDMPSGTTKQALRRGDAL
ncbi:aldo/keto reductase [Sphingobium nicotianae]|uniref:Aldo/keto reductase n=1 Tax=Sphingobium nicotianae TaxID=2782607 RepID=A0A9X1IRD9_9SPHN|nr:aldo/keto reductase [Sphingobium nicotianae]MBT2187366.1 aldo/keto reductase [Sphingobium nicotianae]